MRTIRLIVGILLLATFTLSTIIGIGPELGRVVYAIRSSMAGRVRWDYLWQVAVQRIAAQPLLLLLILTTAFAASLLLTFSLYAICRQLLARWAAEQHSTTYLITLGREDMVPITQMREVWLWLRDGMMQPGLRGWVDRMRGCTPYIVWCDLSQVATPHQAAVYLRVVGNAAVQQTVRSFLTGIHPSAQVKEVAYPTLQMNRRNTWHLRLRLAHKSEQQIRTKFDELVDVRSALHQHLRTDADVPRIEVAYRLRAAGREWAGAARRKARHERENQSIGAWRGEMEQQTMSRTAPEHGASGNWRTKADSARFGWSVEISVTVTGQRKAAQQVICAIASGYFGAFTADNRFNAGPIRRGPAPLGYPVMLDDHNILSPAELAAVCHLSKAANLPGLAASTSKYLPASRQLELAPLHFAAAQDGTRRVQWQPQPLPSLPPAQAVMRPSTLGYNGNHTLGIVRNDRMKGVVVIGPPGVGKSTLLAGIALGDIASGDGVAILEPHRDLNRAVLSRLTRRDWGRVVYIDPQELYEQGRAVTLNVLEGASPLRLPLIQAQTVQVIRAMMSANWEVATRMQSLLDAALGTILEQEPNPTFRTIARFMGNGWYRDKLKSATANPDYRHFWDDYFDRADERDRQQMVSPVYTRVTKALQNPYAAQVVSSHHSSINLGQLMDDGAIILVNLPGLGRDSGDQTMSMLAMLIIAKLRVDAEARRSRVPEQHRRPFYTIIDEAHLVINANIEDMIAQFRKFRVGLTMAFQTPSQLDKDTLNVLSATMQNKIMFRGEGSDAEILATQMLNSEVLPTDVNTQPNRTAYARLLWNEVPQPVCSLETLALPEPPPFNYAKAALEVGIRTARDAHPAANDEVRGLLDMVAATLKQAQALYADPDNPARYTKLSQQEGAAIAALLKTSDSAFATVRTVQQARDRALADWLLTHPAACRNQVELIQQVSMLRHSVPAVLVKAEVRREEAAIQAAMQADGVYRQKPRKQSYGTRSTSSSAAALPPPPLAAP